MKKNERERVLELLESYPGQPEKVARIVGIAPCEVKFLANPLGSNRAWTVLMHRDGLTAKEIAERLGIAVFTIKRYLEAA